MTAASWSEEIMRKVGAFEAKNKFGQLLDCVAAAGLRDTRLS